MDDVTLEKRGGPVGLSAAQSNGADDARASSDVLAFLDDGAEAAPEGLERPAEFLHDHDVPAVGGRVEPAWEYVPPAQFGGELGRIVGCSRSGLLKAASEARKVIGANMCFRREVLRRVGGINLLPGRECSKPMGCEEPEFLICSKLEAPGHGTCMSQRPWRRVPDHRRPRPEQLEQPPQDWAVQDPISCIGFHVRQRLARTAARARAEVVPATESHHFLNRPRRWIGLVKNFAD